MTVRPAAIALAALVLALAGCGGGDDSNDAGSGSTADPEMRTDDPRAQPGGSADETPEQSGQSGGESGQSGGESGQSGDESARNRSGGSKPDLKGGEELKRDDDRPARPLKENPKRDSELPSGAPTPKTELSPQERQAYETAEFFCGREGVDGMRREYSIESTHAADIAREAARRYYDRTMEEAVYSGCLAGLLQAS